MRYLSLLLVVLFGGCGERAQPSTVVTAPEPSALTADASGPQLLSLEIQPNFPIRGDSLLAEARVSDSRGAVVQSEFAWYRNGQLLQQGPDARLQMLDLVHGDEIRVDAQVSDGRSPVSARSAFVTIDNTGPEITSVRIEPAEVTGASELRAVVSASDADDEPLEISYRWWRNGELIRNASEAVLAPGNVKRLDWIRVSGLARDSNSDSGWVDSPEVRVGNSAPVIRSQPRYEPAAGNQYVYQVVAEDPDGDRPLRYRLVRSPTGMEIESFSGRIHWEIPADVSGEHAVEVSATDPKGAESRQQFSLRIDWGAPPANHP